MGIIKLVLHPVPVRLFDALFVRGVAIPAPDNPLSGGYPVPESLRLVVVDGPDLETHKTWQLGLEMSQWKLWTKPFARIFPGTIYLDSVSTRVEVFSALWP